jgi:hypothetical protein
MAVSIMEAEAQILKVEDGRGRWSIEADVPALGKYPTRFIQWHKIQGNAPAVGTDVMATLEPTGRQARFVKDGTFDGEEVDGSEMPWQVNWRMTAFEPLEGGGGSGGGNPPTPVAPPVSGAPRAVRTALPVDANLRHRVDAMSINDRESVRLAISFGAAEGGNVFADLATVLTEAGAIADWLNDRLLGRLNPSPPEGEGAWGQGPDVTDSSMVTAAKAMGAVITDVREDGPPAIKNEAELRAWVEERGWTREEVGACIERAGFGSAREYLADTGNTAQGLASLFDREIKSATDAPW